MNSMNNILKFKMSDELEEQRIRERNDFYYDRWIFEEKLFDKYQISVDWVDFKRGHFLICFPERDDDYEDDFNFAKEFNIELYREDGKLYYCVEDIRFGDELKEESEEEKEEVEEKEEENSIVTDIITACVNGVRGGFLIGLGIVFIQHGFEKVMKRV